MNISGVNIISEGIAILILATIGISLVLGSFFSVASATNYNQRRSFRNKL